MKSKYWDLGFIILGILIIVSTFIKELESKSFFGMEINIWVYRLIWVFIIYASFNGYKKKQNN